MFCLFGRRYTTTEEDSDEGYSSDIDELKDKVKRLNKEAARLGYRIALMKPKSNEENK